jgi:integrase
MAINKLTAAQVSRAKLPGLHGDGGGLYLHVGKTPDNRSWVFRYRRRGTRQTREMGLGPLHTVSLAEARVRAQRCRLQLLDGIDPLDVKHEQRQASRLATLKCMSFQKCAESYIEDRRAAWTNAKSAQQWENTLKEYVYPLLGKLPVAAIDTGLVIKTLEPIWKTKPETASRVRGRIEAVLGWATVRGYRAGDNPALWRNHLDKVFAKRSELQEVAHLAALPYGELFSFMSELKLQEGLAARALKFTILTVSRSGEVLGAVWDEIDLDRRLWTIPGSRMKAGREHRVPLANAALAILRPLYETRGGPLVFPGARPGRRLTANAMLEVLKRMGRGGLTVHGFRSCFSDWCTECTEFSPELREIALAHTVSDKVEAAYRRGDMLAKRYRLAEAWASFATTAPVSEEVHRLWA